MRTSSAPRTGRVKKTGRIDRDTGACNKSNHLNPTDNLSDRASDRLLQLVDNQSRT